MRACSRDHRIFLPVVEARDHRIPRPPSTVGDVVRCRTGRAVRRATQVLEKRLSRGPRRAGVVGPGHKRCQSRTDGTGFVVGFCRVEFRVMLMFSTWVNPLTPGPANPSNRLKDGQC